MVLGMVHCGVVLRMVMEASSSALGSWLPNYLLPRQQSLELQDPMIVTLKVFVLTGIFWIILLLEWDLYLSILESVCTYGAGECRSTATQRGNKVTCKVEASTWNIWINFNTAEFLDYRLSENSTCSTTDNGRGPEPAKITTICRNYHFFCWSLQCIGQTVHGVRGDKLFINNLFISQPVWMSSLTVAAHARWTSTWIPRSVPCR